MSVPLRDGGLHLGPLATDVRSNKICVRIAKEFSVEAVLFDETNDLLLDVGDGVELGVRVSDRRLEGVVCPDKFLDLSHLVHDDQVGQVFPRSIQPVVEGRSTLREVQIKLVQSKVDDDTLFKFS